MALLRGTTEYAQCETCPLGKFGRPDRPVVSEFPEDPKWLIVGEGPGMTEIMQGRPFVGPSGQIVEKILRSLGVPRESVYIGNATCCIPPRGADEQVKQLAAQACNTRLKMELRKFPSKPILTLGAIAAKAVIPKTILDAIDPPDVPPSHKRKQKHKQRAKEKAEERRLKSIDRINGRLLKSKIKYFQDQVINECVRASRRKPRREYIDRRLDEVLDQLKDKASREAVSEYERKQDEKAAKREQNPKKKKTVKITDIVSTHFFVDVDDSGIKRSVIPAIHPAAILRGGGKTIAGTHTPDLAFLNIVYDAAKINALASGKDIVLRFPTEVEWQDADRANRLFKRFYHDAIVSKSFALDLETYVEDPERHHALQMFKAKIRAIGLSTIDRGISIIWDLLSASNRLALRILLASLEIEKIFHNGLYDRTVLEGNGYRVAGSWQDSMLGHHAAFPGMAHNLQQVTAQFWAVTPWKSEFRNQEETPEGLVTYCAKDTHSTIKDWQHIDIWIKRTKTEQVYAMDKIMAETASRMHLAGVPISRQINQETSTRLIEAIKKAKIKIEELAQKPENRDLIWHHLAFEQAKKFRKADSPDFRARHATRLAEIKKDYARDRWKWKVSSNQHIAALLRSLGVQLTMVTETGQTKVNKEILESLVEVPIVRSILNFRESDKLYGTFVGPMFDRWIFEDFHPGFVDQFDRAHPIWSVHKITGRWASGDPVFSNVPKELRGQVVAQNGRILVGFDFAQLEARLAALLSNDEWLCSIFARGLDIHVEVAKAIWPTFNQLEPKQQAKLRQDAKPFEYGAIYGADPETLYRNLIKEGHNVKREDVYAAYNRVMGQMPGLARYQQEIVLAASQPPYQITSFLLKRRRVFPMGNADRNECLNYPAQSGAADIMNTGMARMIPRLMKYKQAFPILQIHDAAVFEVWEDDAPRFAEDVKEAFTQEYGGIPFPVDVKIAHSWDKV